MDETADAMLVSAGYDHTIRFWNIANGCCIRMLQHTESQVNALAISPDHHLIAAAGYQHIRIYEAQQGSTNAQPIVNYEVASSGESVTGHFNYNVNFFKDYLIITKKSLEKFESLTTNTSEENNKIVICYQHTTVALCQIMDEIYSKICWKIDDNQHELLQRFISGLGDAIVVNDKDNENDDSAAAQTSNQENGTSEENATMPTSGEVLDYKAILNREFKAVASFVVSPVEFYLQPTFWTDEVDRLDQEMTDYYISHNDTLSHAVPFDRMAYENMPCVVAYDNDGTYYRARVTHIGAEDCKIVFCDWGNGQFAKFSDMRPLMKQFAVVPPLALRCRLDGVVERTLVRSVIDKFNTKISGNLSKRFLCVIKRVKNNVFYVDLFDTETKMNIGSDYMPTDDMVPGFTSRCSLVDKMNKKDKDSATPGSKKSKKRSSSSDSSSTDSDAVVCYDSETECFTTFSGEILAPIRPARGIEEAKKAEEEEKSKEASNQEFKNAEGWPSAAPAAVEEAAPEAPVLIDSGTSASPPPAPDRPSTSKNVVDSSTSPTRPSTPTKIIFKVKAPAPRIMREAATQPQENIEIIPRLSHSNIASTTAAADNVTRDPEPAPSPIFVPQEPVFEEFRPVLVEADEYYRYMKDLDEKLEKYKRGEYANTLEAFLDGVPLADDGDEFYDSSEEEAKEQRRKERKKKKTLKQMRRELEANRK